MKRVMLSGFQKDYTKEIISQCNYFKVIGCMCIDGNKNDFSNLEFYYNRSKLRVNRYIKDNSFFYDTTIVEGASKYLLNAITLYDRYDVNNSISASQRIEDIYQNISFWIDVFKNNKIDVIISREIPHLPHEYCLYIASKIGNIKMLMFDNIIHLKRTLCVGSIEERHIATKNSSQNSLEYSTKILKILQGDRRKVVENSDVPKMLFWKKWTLLSWCKYIGRDLLSLLKHGIFSSSYVDMILSKKQYLQYKNPNHFKVKYYFFKLRFKSLFYELLYYKLSNKFNLKKYDDKKIIIYFANYQPERTTNPDGGYFYNTLNTLKLMQNNLPNDYKILYKEHPHTFTPSYKILFRGASFRSIAFFKNIVNLNIDLVPISFDSSLLIKRSEYVVSISGSVLIESITQNIHSIMFGNNWIESLPGIVKVKSSEEFIKILNSKQSNNQIKEENIIKSFASIYDESTEHLTLLNDIHSVENMKDEVKDLLKYIKDKV